MSETFWSFSCRFYRVPGVAAACLALQDENGADVNLLLFALWAAARGRRLEESELAAAEQIARPWRENVTEKLRAARRAMKVPPAGYDAAGMEALRRKVLEDELEAERLQQEAMAAALGGDAGTAMVEAAQDNLRGYQAMLGRTLGAEPLERLMEAFAASEVA